MRTLKTRLRRAETLIQMLLLTTYYGPILLGLKNMYAN